LAGLRHRKCRKVVKSKPTKKGRRIGGMGSKGGVMGGAKGDSGLSIW
jgi:hypothetical protein